MESLYSVLKKRKKKELNVIFENKFWDQNRRFTENKT